MITFGFDENKCKREVYVKEEIDDKTTILQTTDSNLQTQINRLASGSPLVASSVEGMTDTTKTYVNTTDGNWYYYNGANWVVGGVYQATGLSTTDTDLINSFKFFLNLFNGKYNLAFPNLGFIQNGVYTDYTGSTYYTSDYILIDLMRNIDLSVFVPNSTSVTVFSVYDSNKNYLDGNNTSYKNLMDIVGAKYIRVSYNFTTTNGIPIVVKNDLRKLSSKKLYVNNGFKTLDCGLRNGVYSSGVPEESTTRVSSLEHLKVFNLEYKIKVNENYQITLQLFDTNKKFTRYILWANEIYFTPSKDECYLLFNIKRNDEGALTVDSKDDINIQMTEYISVLENDALLNEYLPKVHNRWKNKTINFLGDSITAGLNVGIENSWVVKCSEILQANYNNYGISNSTIANPNNSGSNDPMCLRYMDMSNNADLVVVLAGRNDYRSVSMPLGTINDTDNSTFYGGLKTLVEGLWNKYPLKTIVFCTPFKARVSEASEKRDNEWSNNVGLYQESYNNAIKEVCKMYAIPVIDLYNEGTFNSWNDTAREVWFTDTIHPSIEGHKVLGEIVASRLNNI
jgi:lysophospholipase L1-like esterase